VKEEWLALSKSCLDFMENHCINHELGGRMYFTVTEDGQPLRQRRYCFSEAFYAAANAEYYGVTGEREHLDRARWAYNLYWDIAHGAEDPVGMGPKSFRAGRGFGTLMIILNVIDILLRVDPEHADEYEQRSRQCVDEIFQYHVKPELKCILENVDVDGTPRLHYTEGRTVNPGHDIEGVWFILEHAKRTGRTELIPKAAEIFEWAMEAGWDKEYGGLLYFVDCLGLPPEAYEHDMKLWWAHNESLIASLMLYRDIGDEKYLDWFHTVADYAEKHFCDPEYGEWYGYLRRDGLPTQPSTKGSTFKGPFHVPRCLVMLDQMMNELEQR
jgi:N-acylglucosamine 2-epimerase